MKKSAANIREYHELQKPRGFRLNRGGAWMEQIVRPLSSAGVYVGSSAARAATDITAMSTSNTLNAFFMSFVSLNICN